MAIKFTLRKLFLFLVFPSVICHLPSDLSAQYSKFWIQFTDKNNNPYSVSNPSAFLSSRAILRRTVQGISVIQNDLPVTPSYIDSVKAVPNVTVINRSKWFNAVTIFTTDTNALNTINAFSFVGGVQPVQRLHGNRKIEEESYKDVFLTEKKKETVLPFSYNYGPSFHQINMINGVCLHNNGFDGTGMQIAVLDAGFWKVDSLPAFDSLRTNGQILGTWDFVGNDSMVYDAHTHGMMVLSLMGGNIPGQIVGTAPKAKYWLLRTEEGATEYIIEEDNWVSGAEFADSCGADVFNTSLGYTEFDDSTQNHAYADMDGNTTRITIATDIAASKGILPVNSAGNSAWSPWFYIGAPADADSVLAVGAVDSLMNCAGFSSRGPSFDGRVKPNVAAMGQDVYTASPGGGIGKGSGTSFSSPITAGMVACLWQANPGTTNMQVFNAIQQSASQFLVPDSLLGYGIPDFCAADILLSQMEQNNKKDEIYIYPNPTSGEFKIQIGNGQWAVGNQYRIEIVNVLGEKVYEEALTLKGTNTSTLQGGGQTFSISLPSGLGHGIYFLNLRAGEKSYSAKVLKY